MQDPVCKMEVNKNGIKFDFKGNAYYFCSENCKAQFMIDPKKFLK